MSRWRPLRDILLATSALAPLSLTPVAWTPASANPQNGQVVGGAATIQSQGSTLTVNQTSDRTVINWQTFNIGVGETTRFVQPSSSAIALNRVTGGLGPSLIDGTLSANGRVFIINADGIMIGAGARIDTAGFLATTNDIRNVDFMGGRYVFSIPGRPDASVVNAGTITASNAGFAALVAPGVRNSGTITATFGKIGLASANGFTLDFYGDKLITLNVSDSIAASVKDVSTGQALTSLVSNDGKLKANGGQVQLTAVAARKIVDSVINTSGVIEARSIGHRNGKIVLGGPTATTKVAGAPTQTVKVSGKLDVSGKKKGATGGTIQVTGENIVLASATLDASGYAGGGKVLIGGDVGGGNGNPAVASIAQAKLEGYAVPNATSVSIDAASAINASAISSGSGGKVVVWSDGNTSFAGAIAATGGATSGNGGFVEVSGHQTLAFTGAVDTKAANGQYGTLLLDPGNVSIVTTGVDTTTAGSGSFTGSDILDTTLTVATLENALSSSNVIVQTGKAAGFNVGDIIVSGVVTWSSGSTLTLSAYRNIEIQAQGVNTATLNPLGSSSLVLRADSTGTGNGTLILGAGTFDRRIDATASTGTVTIYYNPTSYTSPMDFTTGNGRIYTNSGVSNQVTEYMLVNTAGNLADISNNLSGNYALGRDIDLTSVSNFAPLGTFTGRFNGLDQTISNLTIAPTSPSVSNIGLFGVIGHGAVVRNLTLENIHVTANPSLSGTMIQNVGTLAGINAGKIRNVNVTGTSEIDGGSVVGLAAGGLVGQNGLFDGTTTSAGKIRRSSADVTIVAGDGSNCTSSCLVGFNVIGGLVGYNAGTIKRSSASGDITVGANTIAGGLVGINQRFTNSSNVVAPLIDDSFATGNVTASSISSINVQLGGLVGYNFGVLDDFAGAAVISDSRATGAVTAHAAVDNSGCNGGLGVCQFVNAGGLVGFNQGIIFGSAAPDVRHNPARGVGTYATGAVSVGSGGIGGGLAGQNDGTITTALATGDVTGAAGTPGTDSGRTRLGGLVGTNHGLIDESGATGKVGGAGIAALEAGGLVGSNGGTILASFASGKVKAGDSSSVGGLTGSSDSGNSDCNNTCSPGLAFNNAGAILASIASGAVTAGSSSFVGGLTGTGGLIGASSASGPVTGGANSAIGGLAGAISLDGIIALSSATGAVTSTGAGSVVGGLVGANGGTIGQSFATGAVSGTSDSYLGGLAGISIGTILNVSALVNSTGTVQGTGANNVAGGLVGFNTGAITGTSSSSNVTSGANSIVGGLIGVNTGLIDSSTAAGMVTAGAGSTIGTLIGVDNATNSITIPPFPTTITGCDDAVCQAFAAASVLPSPSTTPETPDIPDDVLAPIIVVTLLASPDHTDHVIAAAIMLAALTPPAAALPDGGGAGQPGPAGPAANGGQPFAPPMVLRPIAGPDGERFSSIPPVNETRFFPDQVLLQVPGNVSPDEVARVARELGLSVISTENLSSSGRIAFQLRLGNGRTVRDVIRALEANRITAIAQPNYRFSLMQPAGGEQQSDNPQYAVDKLHLTEAHRTVSGRGVTIAVIDSEVDQKHTELKGAISDELNVLGADVKAHPHGTAMVGAIASRDRLVGVAPGAKIIAVRAFGETTTSAEGTTYNILKGIEWAVSQGARIINMSFAGPYDPSLARALKAAADKGVVLISAAGNAGPKSPALFPGADPNVIAVTATDSTDKLFRMANQGGYVSVSAPGVEVLAPAPEEAYQMSTGTSIATAHVSGIVALMLESDPTLKPAEVRKILETTAVDLGPKGRDNQFGWGLINPQKALAAVDARRKAAGAGKP